MSSQHKLTLQTLFENYISDCTYSKQLRPQTIKSYCQVFETFKKIMPETVTVSDLHNQILNEFFKRISTRTRIVGKISITSGVKPSTIKTYYNKLIAFFRWLEHHNHLNKSITPYMTKPPSPKYDDQKALSDEEVSKIIASVTLYSMDYTFLYSRDIAIISLLLYTGIRKGELLALRIGDVNFQQRTLFINGSSSKSKRSRYIPIHYALISHLKSYLKERELLKTTCQALIISSKEDRAFTVHGMKYWVKKYSRLSGVKFHIHRFRHTFACKLAKQNADIVSIMKVMGHATTQMTERYLRSIQSENSRSYIDKLTF